MERLLDKRGAASHHDRDLADQAAWRQWLGCKPQTHIRGRWGWRRWRRARGTTPPTGRWWRRGWTRPSPGPTRRRERRARGSTPPPWRWRRRRRTTSPGQTRRGRRRRRRRRRRRLGWVARSRFTSVSIGIVLLLLLLLLLASRSCGHLLLFALPFHELHLGHARWWLRRPSGGATCCASCARVSGMMVPLPLHLFHLAQPCWHIL